MGTREVRISEELYARVEAERRDDETMGETLERMVGGYDLVEFAEASRGEESLDVQSVDAETAAASDRNDEELRDDLGLE
ncbi:MAG: hypothetical protein ABEI75_01245 [Halobaculum sp.]